MSKCTPPNGPFNFPDDSMIGNHTTQNNTTYTSTSTIGQTASSTWRYPYAQRAEQGWECPRCGRINAPWVSFCDCHRDNWTVSWNNTKPDYNNEWWKTYITCQQGTSPITNSDTFKVHPECGPVYTTMVHPQTSEIPSGTSSNVNNTNNTNEYNIQVSNDTYTGYNEDKQKFQESIWNKSETQEKQKEKKSNFGESTCKYIKKRGE